jgi:hypothetical protein
MSRFHGIGRLAVLVAGLAGVLAVFCAGGAPAAAAGVTVPPGGDPPDHLSLASLPPRPPGWNKHPPLPDPARVHAALAGGIPGWQVSLMAVTLVLLVATLVAIANPGPGRARAGERTHRLNATTASSAGVRPSGSTDGGPAPSTRTRAGSALPGG